MQAGYRVLLGVMAVAMVGFGAGGSVGADLASEFREPPLAMKSRPLWFWNGPLAKAGIEEQMRRSRDESGYYGFGILPSKGMTPDYASKAFLDRYGDALDQAARLGMKMCLYDEYWFPSGSAGGQLAAKYPQHTAKRLDMHEEDVQGPKSYKKKVPPGTLMAAVALRVDGATGPLTPGPSPPRGEGNDRGRAAGGEGVSWAAKERIDLARHVAGGELAWDVPAGSWKVMLFVCVRDGWDHVDYLNPDSVQRFIELTYQRFYNRFPKHFGTTIDSAFYDEPTFWTVQGGRMWTEGFNRKFRAKHGFDPAVYYPGLWYDIGPETAAARNALFGLRAELFAAGFVKTINDWCRAHRIQLTGHVDQEEIVNPVGLCGDLIKAFKYQDIPGIDQIFQYGRASKAYKLVSSAATNYDRPLVMTETYGAMGKLKPPDLYREAMDQYAKGINLMVPHAVWYEPRSIIFPPELSYRHPLWGPELPAYNKYVGRLNLLLQSGVPAADCAVLYPIAALQAGYRFGVGKPYEGGIVPDEADYMDVGELLSLAVRRDFTYLHPEVLDEKCTVRGDAVTLDNAASRQTYRVLIVPGSKTIAASNLAKIKQFYDQGGKVIATTQLPHRSAEFGQDDKVRAAIRAILGVDPRQPVTGELAASNARGGKAYFLPKPSAESLSRVLDDALAVWDVKFVGTPKPAGGNLSYLHKIREGRGLWFFANSSDTAVDVPVTLRGRHEVEAWDPHTGAITPAAVSHAVDSGQEVTRLRLLLPPVRSVFLLERLPTRANK